MTDLIVRDANFVWEYFYCFQSMHKILIIKTLRKTFWNCQYFDILFQYNNTPPNNNSFIAYSQNRKSNHFLLIPLFNAIN